jgi:molecular chaperone DnaK (HSP70)
VEAEVLQQEHLPRLEPAGQPLDIRCTYDLNGVIEVEATIVETKKMVSHVVTRHARGLSAKQIAEAVKEMEKQNAWAKLTKEKAAPAKA